MSFRSQECVSPADFREELRRLNRELLFAFVGMLGAVAEAPSQSARSVELVGALARNLQHLLNMLRPHQVNATCLHCRCPRPPDLRSNLRPRLAPADKHHHVWFSLADEV